MSFHRFFAALVMPFHYTSMLHLCQLFTMGPPPWVVLQLPCHFSIHQMLWVAYQMSFATAGCAPCASCQGFSLLLCQLVNCHLILATLVTTPARP
ncbi:hypothetical protein H4582DRAFT_2028356 [Lactarius indigo]|nr:hypothetical protein H4582DRAFT_2028356 [Lactarius indigo]